MVFSFDMCALRRKCCIPYMINDVVDFICSPPGTGKGLDVGRGLSHRECSNKHDEEHLKTNTYITLSSIKLLVEGLPNVKSFSHNATTHGEYRSNGVLLTQDECTAIPESQSIGHVDHQEGEAHGNIGRNGLLYSHVLCILQVLMISVVQHTHKTDTKISTDSMDSKESRSYMGKYILTEITLP